MVVADVTANKSQFECFQCGSKISFGDGKFIALSTQEGVIEILNPRTGRPAAMVFCTSDCMVLDSHLRYLDRTTSGKFRKVFNVLYNDAKRLPETFRDEAFERAVKDFNVRTGT